jgi:response regulator RpfG family c-di-GMP phosphodiesterase
VASKIALVIEDPDIHDMMKEMLEAENYEVIACRPSRLDCRREIDYVQPNLVLLDVPFNRPAFTIDDALNLVNALKSDMNTREIPIVLCSTVEQVLSRHRARWETLTSDFIAKPFEMTDLLERIARHVGPKAA